MDREDPKTTPPQHHHQQQQPYVGVPTRLLRKTTLVQEGPDRLPVHTLTFAMPPAPLHQQKDNDDNDDDTNKDVSPSVTNPPHNNNKNHKNKNKGTIVHPSCLRLDLGDVMKVVIPQYKAKSYSVSALRHNEFDITFKVYPNGRASGYLDRLQMDDTIFTFGLSKGRVRNDDTTTTATMTHVGIIAYGVGITEAWPMAKAELEHVSPSSTKTVTLIWAARTRADTFWHDEIQQYQRRQPPPPSDPCPNPTQVVFTMHYIFSRDDTDPNSFKGHINANLLTRIFCSDWKEKKKNIDTAAIRFVPRFLSVGTKEMMAQTDELLASIGYPMPEYALLLKKKKKSIVQEEEGPRERKGVN
jgi:NAD(P)H-flavin reductase